MRATRNFICHRGGGESGLIRETRRFRRDEKIPEDWMPFIGTQSLVDEPLAHLEEEGQEFVPDPFPDFKNQKNVDDVAAWIGSGSSFEDRLERARHALSVETGPGGRGRKGVIDSAQSFLEME